MTAPNTRKSKTAEHESPYDLWEVLDERYGPFDLDPAAAVGQRIATTILDRGGAICIKPDTPGICGPRVFLDGLASYWGSTEHPSRVWLNCPYDQKSLSDWTDKAVREVTEGRALVVCALLPAVKSEQDWWQRNVMRSMVRLDRCCNEEWKVSGCPVLQRVWFVPGRQQFTGAAGATFPSVVVVWGKQPLG